MLDDNRITQIFRWRQGRSGCEQEIDRIEKLNTLLGVDFDYEEYRYEARDYHDDSYYYLTYSINHTYITLNFNQYMGFLGLAVLVTLHNFDFKYWHKDECLEVTNIGTFFLHTLPMTWNFENYT